MGEYATVDGVDGVKLGTCEAMYYLRADDVPRVTGYPAFRDDGYKDWALFRFPWPWEDDIEPGAYEGAWGRGLTIWGASVPEGVDHGIVQLTHRNGYLVNAPCPEAHDFEAPDGWAVHRNGYGGAVALVAQRYWEGALVGVCECKGCGHLYRMPTLADAADVLDGIAAMAEREIRVADENGTEGNRDIAARYLAVARRLSAGYEAPTRAAV